MNDVLTALSLLFSLAASIGVLLLLSRRPASAGFFKIECKLEAINTALSSIAGEMHAENARLRAELENRLALDAQTRQQQADALRDTLGSALEKSRVELANGAAAARAGQDAAATETRKSLDARLDALSTQNITRLEQIQRTLAEHLDRARAASLESAATARAEQNAAAAEMRKTLDTRLENLATQNAAKLEEMRLTVDEKLQGTLEKRLGENFKQVSERLENVHKSLGEMQSVATDVSDLKRVLANVKTRGTWGEIQLGALLESLLLPEQYAANVKPNPRAENIVEFAIRLPGPEEGERPVWLPIDAKFPKEDYERLSDAARRADTNAMEQATAALASFVKKSARDIRDKYIHPPYTTDFAILFLPTEGLYAEVLRAGIVEEVQREFRILIAGPTILGALLNSLQMGFRTLAIQKRSGEVWRLLGHVKTQFGTFGDLLEKVGKKLEAAGTSVAEAAARHRIITNRLSKVEAIPEGESPLALAPDSASPERAPRQEGIPQ
ncbi:MAG: DNA recombination protein RmuC [Puniceicoccales bacterium]|jgi:DNA recombination protein RmuC|nr:DNA recombination protein RmuC [Puniceicoccales bacterium]